MFLNRSGNLVSIAVDDTSGSRDGPHMHSNSSSPQIKFKVFVMVQNVKFKKSVIEFVDQGENLGLIDQTLQIHILKISLELCSAKKIVISK